MNRAYLQALDELRYSDPEEARRLAELAVEQAPAALLPLSLGILGSAFRSLGRLAEAEEAIVTGIELARRSEDWWTTGNLVARQGYVVGDQGDMHGAAELAAEACTYYLCAGDRDGVGRCLVDRGRAVLYLERCAEALAYNEWALTFLAPKSRRHRFSALMNAGVACTELGYLARAEEYCRRCSELAEGLGPALAAKRLGLVAQIAELRQDFSAAAEALLEAAAIYFKLSPVDSALASVRAVEMIMAAGDAEGAQEAVLTLAKYLEACRKTPAVTGALIELIRKRNSLTLETVRRAAQAVAAAHGARDRVRSRRGPGPG